MWRFTRVDVLCRGDFSRSLGNKRGAIDGEVWEPSRSTAPIEEDHLSTFLSIQKMERRPQVLQIISLSF